MTTICERKSRYASQGLALKAAQRQSRNTGDVIQPYLCTDCGGWHIGHPRLKAPAHLSRRSRRR